METVPSVAGRNFGGVEQHQTWKTTIWKEAFFENVNSLINDVKIAKAESVEMFVEKNLTLARFKEHFRLLWRMVSANVELMVTLSDAMAKMKKMPKRARSLDRLDYSLNIERPTQVGQRLVG